MAIRNFRDHKKKQDGLAARAKGFFKRLFTRNKPDTEDPAGALRFAPRRYRMPMWMRSRSYHGVSDDTQRWLMARAEAKRDRKNEKRLLGVAAGGFHHHSMTIISH